MGMMYLQQVLDFICQSVPQARLVGDGATPVARVHTDTRTLQPGDLFVALKGERFDANAFLADADGRRGELTATEALLVDLAYARDRDDAGRAPLHAADAGGDVQHAHRGRLCHHHAGAGRRRRELRHQAQAGPETVLGRRL